MTTSRCYTTVRAYSYTPAPPPPPDGPHRPQHLGD
jgi:hypothetical protein